MTAKYRDEEEVSSARQVIEAAQLRVAQLRRTYLESAAHGVENDPSLRADFHAAVMEYYLALRPYRDEGAVESKWDDAILWTEDDGSKVRGFDSLGDWINRRKVVGVDSSSRGQNAESDSRPDHLPPQRLIRVSSALDDIAKRLGIGINVSSGRRPGGLLEQTLAEDADERAATDGGEDEQ